MKINILIIAISLLSFSTFSQNTGSIEVTITDIKKHNEGEIAFVLFNKKEGFPNERNKAFKIGIVKQFNSTASYTFTNIPFGEYAVFVHQDKDENREIKKNFIGMPKEPVGASNLTKMGKPTFKKSVFSLDNKLKTINIKFIIAN